MNTARTVVRVTFAFAAFLLVLCGVALNSEAQDKPAQVFDNPPRFEIGGIVSAGKQTSMAALGGNDYFHVGGGGRFTVNATRYLAGEVEFTAQPTDAFGYGREYHTTLALKGTYRVEEKRWLGFAGINLFGVIGPALLNHTVLVDNPSPSCISCGLQKRVTTTMVDFGGGAEIVPARNVAIRFDVTHASFDEMLFLSNGPTTESRTYIKVSLMLRFP